MSTVMQTAKQDLQELLNHLPDDTSIEDIHYHFYVLEKIRRGEERAKTEGTLKQHEVEERLRKWITK